MPNSTNNGQKEKSRLIYIEPNEFASTYHKSANTTELCWNYEDLTMAVDLQVIIPRREDCGQRSYLVESEAIVKNTQHNPLGRYVSFLGGTDLGGNDDNNTFLTNNYTEVSYQEISQNQTISKETLGINSIDINFDANFFPIITMKFTDTRGYSLFMPSEYEFDESVKDKKTKQDEVVGSFFKALFHFPYPMFLLSVKGFYGNRVTFRLSVSDFRSAFNADNGNFDVTVQFIGYVYGLYTDLPLNLVMASPFYNSEYWKNKTEDGTFTYISANGGNGGKIIKYPEFVQRLESLTVTSESLSNAKNVEQYARNDKEIDLLKEIAKCHKELCDATIPDTSIRKYSKILGDETAAGTMNFLYGSMQYLDKTKYGENIYGFPVDRQKSESYYKVLKEFLKNYPDDTNVVSNGKNTFINSFLRQKNKNGKQLTLKDITNDGTNQYMPVFSYLHGSTDINSAFSFKENTHIISGYNEEKKIENIITNGGLQTKLYIGKDLVTKYITDNYIKHYIFVGVKELLEQIQSKIDELDNDNKSLEKAATEELKQVYENVIGFSPTVENFYRMLFAHIDCFIHYFHKEILDNVSTDIKNKQRTLNYLKISVNETDIPRSAANTSDANKKILDVFAFPAYYVKEGDGKSSKEVAEYPGNAKDDIPFKTIRETQAVEEILAGVKLLEQQLDAIVENGKNSSIDAPISKLSIFGDNPWKTLKLDKNNDEDDTYRILYYFMCLLAADKMTGITLNKDTLEVTDAYLDRQVDKFIMSGITPRHTLKDKMLKIAEQINNEGVGTVMANKSFVNDYNMIYFRMPSRSATCLNPSSDKNTYNEISPYGIYKYIPLNPHGYDIGKTLDNIEDKVMLSQNEDKTILGITGYGILEDKTEEKLKAFNTSLVKISEAKDYLSGVTEIPFGKYCVSMPRNKIVSEWIFHDTTNPKNEKNQTVPIVTYNTDGTFKRTYIENIRTSSETTTYPILKQSFIETNTEDKAAVQELKSYYPEDTYSQTVSTVNFVGRKESGEEQGVGFLKDTYSATNLFSGLKTIKIDGKDLSLDELVEQNNKDLSLYERYLPLLNTKRCGGSKNRTGDKYAVATYFLATMCGNRSLTRTVNKLNNEPNICEPFRKIDLLYLGGMLYYYNSENNPSKWGGSNKLYELIRDDGCLGHGLLTGENAEDKEVDITGQKDVSMIGLINNTEIVSTLINYFQDWYNNYFILKYDALATKSNVDDANYCTFRGKVSEQTKNVSEQEQAMNSYYEVQGYTTGGDCEKWLRDLAYSYAQVIIFRADKNNVDIKQSEMVRFLKKLAAKLSDETEEEKKKREQTEDKSNTTEDQKRVLYYLLKNLYDKWLCSYSAKDFELHSPEEDLRMRRERFQKNNDIAPENRSEYNNFVYVDQFFRDISNKYIMDAKVIAQIVKDTYKGKDNPDVYNFMAYMAEKNKLLFLALPIYNNIYNASSFPEIFRPNTLYGDSATERSRGIGTTYVLMYTNEVSHHVADGESGDYYRDFPDIGDVTNVNCEDLKLFDFSGSENNDSDLDFSVSAFAVTYSKQNQMYFKKINVSMDNPKVTDESIRNLLMLSDGGKDGSTNQPISIGQNIYSIYSNRSYTCTVEMMGCMNIMPLMYFQLNNIPMFRGLYMIINVKHSIVAGNITTTFTGVRVSKYSLPNLNNFVLNSEIFNKLKDVVTGEGQTFGNGTSKQNSVPSIRLSSNWLENVEKMGKWYQNNIHSYLSGASVSKCTNNRTYYDCPLIGGASVGDDCSSFVKACLQAQGIPNIDKMWINSGSFKPETDLSNILLENGFIHLPYSAEEVKKGDIIAVNNGNDKHHVEVYYGTDSNGKDISYSWGNVHDGLNNHYGMPCPTTRKNKDFYKHIYRRNS